MGGRKGYPAKPVATRKGAAPETFHRNWARTRRIRLHRHLIVMRHNDKTPAYFSFAGAHAVQFCSFCHGWAQDAPQPI